MIGLSKQQFKKLRAVRTSLPVSVLIYFKRLWIGVFPLRREGCKKDCISAGYFTGKDKEFLRDVLNTYRSNNKSADLRGRCGYSIGSREYLNYAERKVPLQDLPAICSDDYDGGIKGSLEDIVRQLQRDLSQNERENNYITDDTARNLHAAVSELEHCGISTGISDSMIERLAWFVGGNAARTRRIEFRRAAAGGRSLRKKD